jgi:hypothetical protein
MSTFSQVDLNLNNSLALALYSEHQLLKLLLLTNPPDFAHQSELSDNGYEYQLRITGLMDFVHHSELLDNGYEYQLRITGLMDFVHHSELSDHGYDSQLNDYPQGIIHSVIIPKGSGHPSKEKKSMSAALCISHVLRVSQ